MCGKTKTKRRAAWHLAAVATMHHKAEPSEAGVLVHAASMKMLRDLVGSWLR